MTAKPGLAKGENIPELIRWLQLNRQNKLW